jgi:hypothetical protein
MLPIEEYPQTSEADELQAATGEGYDPDQTWDDEPDDDPTGEEVADPDDVAPVLVVIEED